MAERPYEDEAIRNLQRYLLQLSFFNALIPAVPLDGVWDTATRESLRAFQAQYGLPVTGRADRTTWDTLYQAYTQNLSDTGRPEPVYVFPRQPNEYSVGLGDEGALIVAIQFLLRERMIEYGLLLEEQALTQIFDATTEAWVKQFQDIHGLPVTGRVDKATWNELVRANNDRVNRYNPN